MTVFTDATPLQAASYGTIQKPGRAERTKERVREPDGLTEGILE